MSKSFYIVILSYYNLIELKKTINSFINQNYPNFKIIIIDNANSSETRKLILNEFKGCIYIRSEKNNGWSAGNNIGIKYAIKNGADYIILANDDIYFENNNVLNEINQSFQYFDISKINIGLLGTQVNYLADKNLIHNKGWILYEKEEKKGHVFNIERKYANKIKNEKYRCVDSPDGCFLTIRKDVFIKVGLLNENLFMYGDEIDFALRAWRNNIISIVDTSITIFHNTSIIKFDIEPKRIYYRTRNLMYLITNYNNTIFFKLVYIKGVFRTIFKILNTKDITLISKCKCIYATFKGVIAGIIKKTGKTY